jgi:translation initiation factor 2B subunit (eIF-2B alpha/beta/delta family)
MPLPPKVSPPAGNARMSVLHDDLDLLDRLQKIQSHVESVWAENIQLPWCSFHNQTHNKAVEGMLYRLIPESNQSMLSKEEWFYLLAAAWLHDMGMIVTLFGHELAKDLPPEDTATIRDAHHEDSANYIKQNSKQLGLNTTEAPIIAEISRYHRKMLSIDSCPLQQGRVRTRLLAAYLRLADALHLDNYRAPQDHFGLLEALGMPWESRFQWLKSRWVLSIEPEPDKMEICASVYDTLSASPNKGYLPQLVEQEIREELDSVRDVLIRGQISFFLDVKLENLGQLNAADNVDLEMILGNIRLENLSSASEAADGVLGTVLQLAAAGGEEAFNLIQEYFVQVQTVIQHRPCHTLVRTVLNIIRKVAEDGNLTPEQKAQEIRRQLLKHQTDRKSARDKLAQNVRPFLLDCGNVLLYGYSTLVLDALRILPLDVKDRISIYIAEARGKTQYGHANEDRYCDGLKYAVKASEAGVKHVTIIPDIIAGNLMARGLINKVVFGANGIDINCGSFGHSAGHLAIADLAHLYSVPVYVVADTSKFGVFEWQKELERDVHWLTRDSRSLQLLDKHGIATSNPREDMVDPSRVTMLITEVGAFPPNQIPAYIRETRRGTGDC